MDPTVSELARAQFAFMVSFHIIFPAFVVGAVGAWHLQKGKTADYLLQRFGQM